MNLDSGDDIHLPAQFSSLSPRVEEGGFSVFATPISRSCAFRAIRSRPVAAVCADFWDYTALGRAFLKGNRFHPARF